MSTDRRRFLALLLACAVAASPAALAFAKEGESGRDGGGDRGSGGDDGGRGGDDGGNDDSGRDGDNGDGDDGDGDGDDGKDDNGNNDNDGVDDDQKRAIEAERDGKVRKLRDILRTVRREYPGEVLDVQLKKTNSSYVYRVKMMDRSGRVFTVRVDAVERRVLGVGGN